MVFIMKAQTPLKTSKGFALIATISVLMLLTMIAVAFLSLSAVSLKTARIDMAQEEARSNARLALMIALGELQREMGPDQRASATASIFDDSPDTIDISSDIDHPHWLGVWSTNWGESSSGTSSGSASAEDRTPWTRDGQAGGLRDRRFTESWDRETAVATYLVSGNEGGRVKVADAGREFLEPDDALSGGDDEGGKIVDLVGVGSVNDERDMVQVKTVDLMREVRRPNGSIIPTPMGTYGYWITEENTKARISQVDPYESETLNTTNGDGYQRVFHAQDVEAGYMEGWDALASGSADKLLSLRSAELAGIDRDVIKESFHDVTAASRTVLVNARDGGLLKDLSIPVVENRSVPNLENGRLEYIGLNLGSEEEIGDNSVNGDLLVGPPNEAIASLTGLQTDPRLQGISPRFRIIANWLEMSKAQNFSLTGSKLDLTNADRPVMQAPVNYGSPKTGKSNVWDGFLANPASSGEASTSEDVYGVKFTKLDQSTVSPVLVEAGFYYNIATRNRGSSTNAQWQLYIAMYPRVALWNPYNVEMTVPAMLCQMFINGNKSISVNFAGKASPERVRLGFGKGRSPQDGSLWFIVADDVNANQTPKPLVIGPGETIVCTPDLTRSKRQGRLRGNYSIGGDTLNNLLTPYNAESENNYLLDEVPIPSGGENGYSAEKPLTFFEAGGAASTDGGDNFQFLIKDASSYRRVLKAECQRAPMMLAGSISLQAGGGDEEPTRWSSKSPVPVYEFKNNIAGQSLVAVGGSAEPDVRTRDGFRLRWFNENPANTAGSPALGGSEMKKLFETAMIGNWNVRASYFLRSPWDNTSDQPPYYFGNYTRDAFDSAISWANTRSQNVGGRYTGFPFASAASTDNAGPVVLFELPSKDIGIPNLAYLRNMKVSELPWSPTYAIGNSLADPRCESTGTVADLSQLPSSDGGWNRQTMGESYWARLFREFLMYQTDDNHIAFDMSYEINYNLWDTFLMSSGGPDQSVRDRQMQRFADNPADNPLPNGRLGLFNRPDLDTTVEADLKDFFRVAAHLSLEGGFNVNSTSVEAWKAMLASTLKVSVGNSSGVSFPRHLNPSGRTTRNVGINGDSLTGNRDLSEDDIEVLAEEIVAEVKRRAPFFGLSDFVNRRLTTDLDLARAGPIETAIANSGLNSSFDTDASLSIADREDDINGGGYKGMSDATRLDHRLKPSSQAWGLPGYLTQGDVLGVLGSSLTARGDTFKIRTYGESRDVNGKILSRAWCEATVQRTPEPVNPDDQGINPAVVVGDQVDFGRRMRIVGFRWLDSAEI
ncbi:hypothetical protein N9911_00070 [Akkermansiaceae bacterium]|nr:hypothetical protein [bacterium]MDB4316638.1 hypothetical protein [Akkermansiaceae bacterium]MDB4532296.1 hypothetical protein [bacterium]MDC0300686.1 hypothetical protein [Akkermansiaceae bacterium]